MKIIVLCSTQVAGTWYEPKPFAQDVPDNIGEHLVEIGSARPFETKIVEVTEKKDVTFASPAAPVLKKPTRKKRAKRKTGAE